MVKKLKDILKNTDLDIEISGIKTNSSLVSKGDLFVCINGKFDRHNFIDMAKEKGAVALIVQHEVNTTLPYVIVENPDSIIDELYSNFYDHPEDKLTIIGVTGTDGKTSTTTMIQTLIGKDKCGYIGTNGYSCASFERETENTTPGKEMLYQIFYEFVSAGCKYVSMEASSEGFFYNRLNKIRFNTGAYTNIDSEHMNTHKTLNNYIDCKKQLFRQTDNYCILNSHDKHFNDVIDACHNYLTYGYNSSDDLYIKDNKTFPNKSIYTYVYHNKEYVIETKLLGGFNAENLACSLLTLLSMGFKMEELIPKIKDIYIPGRMQVIDLGQDFHCIVDYAHTPNGLTRLFEFVNTLDINNVISVSGQAGERDTSKRKFVGKIIADNSDHVIFTYEDPRHEDINHIIDDMTELIKDKANYEKILDRHDAIQHAIEIAKPNDLILVLGKGSENFNLIGDGYIDFSDVEECIDGIKKRLRI